MDLWIVIPAYNESKRILPTLNDYARTVARGRGNVRILVVSDSTDDTDRIVSSYASKHGNIRLLRNDHRRGKGFAVFNGFKYACAHSTRGSIVGFVDADDSVTGHEITRMIKAMERDGADGIVASRYAKGSVVIGNLGIPHFIASRGYNLLVRRLFGLEYSDTQCGAKFFRKEALEKVLGNMVLFDVSFDLNLFYELKRSGADVREMAIRYVNKPGSSMNIRLPLRSAQMFFVAIGFRIMRSRLGFMLPIWFQSAAYRKIKHW